MNNDYRRKCIRLVVFFSLEKMNKNLPFFFECICVCVCFINTNNIFLCFGTIRNFSHWSWLWFKLIFRYFFLFDGWIWKFSMKIKIFFWIVVVIVVFVVNWLAALNVINSHIFNFDANFFYQKKNIFEAIKMNSLFVFGSNFGMVLFIVEWWLNFQWRWLRVFEIIQSEMKIVIIICR